MSIKSLLKTVTCRERKMLMSLCYNEDQISPWVLESSFEETKIFWNSPVESKKKKSNWSKKIDFCFCASVWLAGEHRILEGRLEMLKKQCYQWSQGPADAQIINNNNNFKWAVIKWYIFTLNILFRQRIFKYAFICWSSNWRVGLILGLGPLAEILFHPYIYGEPFQFL